MEFPNIDRVLNLMRQRFGVIYDSSPRIPTNTNTGNHNPTPNYVEHQKFPWKKLAILAANQTSEQYLSIRAERRACILHKRTSVCAVVVQAAVRGYLLRLALKNIGRVKLSKLKNILLSVKRIMLLKEIFSILWNLVLNRREFKKLFSERLYSFALVRYHAVFAAKASQSMHRFGPYHVATLFHKLSVKRKVLLHLLQHYVHGDNPVT